MHSAEVQGSSPARVRHARPEVGIRAGLALAVFAVVGCNAVPTTVVVRGRVTFDGQPLANGMIVFRAPTGPVRAASGSIKDGRYTLRVPPGLKLVEIHASRDVGEIDPLMKVRLRQRYIPDRYNDHTELKVEIAARGTNVFDFALEK